MAELFSVNFILFISTFCGCSVFIASSRVTETSSILNAEFLTLVGFLIILKDINVIPCRYKIHNAITWLPLEAVLCLAMSEFVIHVIWYRIEEIVEVFVKRVLMENNTTLYYDAGGDSLVNFILVVLSGGFLAFTVFITNTHSKIMNSMEEILKLASDKIKSVYDKITAAEVEKQTYELQPENEVPISEETSPQLSPTKQCITICSPELFENCGDASTNFYADANSNVRKSIPVARKM